MTNGNVLITGATQGLGYEFVKIFAKNNYNLVLIARNKVRLEDIKREFEEKYNNRILIIPIDLSNSNSPKEIFDLLERKNVEVNILINNAGFATYGEFTNIDIQTELDEIQVNIVSLTHITKLFSRKMVASKNGKILNVASVVSFFPGPLMSVYYATKAYVLSLSEALNEEFKGKGVNVTVLCPGPTKTGFAERAQMSGSKLFKSGTMDAEEVVRLGYIGLMQGKTIVIPGFKNKIQTFLVRFVPRAIVTKIVKRALTHSL